MIDDKTMAPGEPHVPKPPAMVSAGSRPSRAVQLDETWVRELASQQWQLPSDSIKITDQGRQSPEDWGWLQKHRCLRLWALPGDRPGRSGRAS